MKKTLLLVFNLLILNGLSFQIMAQGSTCATATVVLPGSFTASGPTTGDGCYNCTGFAEHANWYSFTPTATGFLTVSSCLGGADTRLWVYVGSCASLTLVADNDDACPFEAGSDPWASLVEDVFVIQGNTYYLEWDDQWDDSGFDWTLTFTAASGADIAVSNLSIHDEYTRIPTSEFVGNGLNVDATISNLGASPVTGVRLVVDVYENLKLAFSDTLGAGVSLALGGTEDFSGTNIYTPSNPYASYKVIATAILNEADAQSENNVQIIDIGSKYARDDANPVGGLGIAGPGNVYQGLEFDISATTWLRNVDYRHNAGAAGDTVQVRIYELVNGAVGAIVASGPVTLLQPPFGFNTLKTVPMDVVLTPGKYIVGVYHAATGTNLGLTYTEQNYVPGKAWINVNNGAWSHPEAFNFLISYKIRIDLEQVPMSLPYSQDFDGSLGDMRVVDLDTMPIPVHYWDHTTTGPLSTGALSQLTSTTAANGYAVFDSDGFDNDGVAEDVAMVTPYLDCADFSVITLEFEHAYRSGFGGSIEVAVSNDFGATWDVYLTQVSPNIPNTTDVSAVQLESIDISATAAGHSAVQVRFRWQGDWSWHWSVDDIMVFGEEPCGEINASVTDVSCFGGDDGSIEVDVDGTTAGFTFNWSDGSAGSSISGLSAGTLDLTVTGADGCMSNITVSIGQPDAPISVDLVIFDETEAGENDGSITVIPSGGTPPYTYSWSNGATTAAISDLAPGDYTVTVTDANGCEVELELTIEAGPVNTTNIQSLESLLIYPNPANNFTGIELKFSEPTTIQVDLIDQLGRLVQSVFTGNVLDQRIEINTSEISAGVYYIRIHAGEESYNHMLLIHR